MACLAVADSVVQTWEQQKQSLAFQMLEPSWWGYILGSFLPGSLLFTLKQVCKAWRDLTTSPYYTVHAHLRITTKLLGRLASSTSSLVARPAALRRRIVEQVSLHCGGRICLGLPRTAVEFHGIVIELLKVTGPVQQITVSIDTSYVPVVRALHGLLLRSTETLVELKLRGARVAQQLCAIVEKANQSTAASSDANLPAVKQDSSTTVSRSTDASTSTRYSRRRLVLLPHLRNLETDNVYLLRDLHAPRLLSLFVDYNSVPPHVFAPPASCSIRCSTDVKNNSAPAAAPGAAESTTPSVCPLLSVESDGFPRLVLLEFLSRSAVCLQRLTQAAILPMWSLPRTTHPLWEDVDTQALVQMGVTLPSLKEMSLSDASLLVHLHTVNLSLLALDLSQVGVLPVLFQHQRQQQLAGQLQELVLRLSPYWGNVAPGAIEDVLSHSATCALYKRLHGRLRSSPFPSSSYEAIGSSLQNRCRRIQPQVQKPDEKARRNIPTCPSHEASCWENGGSGGTESGSQTIEPVALFSSATLCRVQPSAKQQEPWEQQQATHNRGTVSHNTIHLTDVLENHPTIYSSETIRTDSDEATLDGVDIEVCPLVGIAKQNTALVKNHTVRELPVTMSFRRHRTWSSKVEHVLNAYGGSEDDYQGCSAFETIFQGCQSNFMRAAASTSVVARADKSPAPLPRAPSPVVVLLNLSHLTAPWTLLGLLVCPNLRRLHVTGMIQRVNVLNFLRAAAPSTESLVIEKLHIDFKDERGDRETEARGIGTGGRSPGDVTSSGENVVTWCLLHLKKYKGPAALLSDEVECPKLQYLEVTDEDTTGELARFLFAPQCRCPSLTRLSLKSFCLLAGVTPSSANTCPASQSKKLVNISEIEALIRGEAVAKKRTAGTSYSVVPVQRYSADVITGISTYLAETAEDSLTYRAHNSQAARSRSIAHFPRLRRSWFDSPSATRLHLLPSCSPADSEKVLVDASSSQARSAIAVSGLFLPPCAVQYRVKALHLSRLNARQVVDWLPVAPPVARALLTRVETLYVDHLVEGRKAMSRLLAALPMLERVEIQRVAGMTERLLTACFAFRSFHSCRKEQCSHRSSNTGKQVAQWCFVKQALRERNAKDADTSPSCSSVGKPMTVIPRRREELSAEYLHGKHSSDEWII